MTPLSRILSGGQTGADRAGLDVAIELGIPHGGHCPRGRRAEDGAIPAKYALRETESADYPERTERNVEDSDGTVVFTFGPAAGGSALTLRVAKKHGRPALHLDLQSAETAAAAAELRTWIESNRIGVLNVAGSRASKAPGIYDAACRVLRAALKRDANARMCPACGAETAVKYGREGRFLACTRYPDCRWKQLLPPSV